jgi:hypothetical protein
MARWLKRGTAACMLAGTCAFMPLGPMVPASRKSSADPGPSSPAVPAGPAAGGRLTNKEAPFLLSAAARVMPARRARRQATGRARLAACSSSSNAHPAPPVKTAELPACTVYLFDAATETHVYLIGSIHVRTYTSCACCGWCKNKRVRLHTRARRLY